MVLITQIKRFGTQNTSQKNGSPLQSIVLEKIKKNCWKLAVSNKKRIFDYFLQLFSDSLKNGAV